MLEVRGNVCGSNTVNLCENSGAEQGKWKCADTTYRSVQR